MLSRGCSEKLNGLLPVVPLANGSPLGSAVLVVSFPIAVLCGAAGAVVVVGLDPGTSGSLLLSLIADRSVEEMDLGPMSSPSPLGKGAILICDV
jgi:hypothetical protein